MMTTVKLINAFTDPSSARLPTAPPRATANFPLLSLDGRATDRVSGAGIHHT